MGHTAPLGALCRLHAPAQRAASRESGLYRLGAINVTPGLRPGLISHKHMSKAYLLIDHLAFRDGTTTSQPSAFPQLKAPSDGTRSVLESLQKRESGKSTVLLRCRSTNSSKQGRASRSYTSVIPVRLCTRGGDKRMSTTNASPLL